MNPESPKSPRDELEARITALLLGELSAEEAESLQKQIAHDSELSRLHYELKHAIQLVRETVGPASHETLRENEPLALSNERREKLLQSFKVTRPKQFRSQRSRAERREWLAVAAMAIGLLVIGTGIVAYHRNEGRWGRSQHTWLFPSEVSQTIAPEAKSERGGSPPSAARPDAHDSESSSGTYTLTVTPAPPAFDVSPAPPAPLVQLTEPKPLSFDKPEAQRKSDLALDFGGESRGDLSGKKVANGSRPIALPDAAEPVSTMIIEDSGESLNSISDLEKRRSGVNGVLALGGEFVPFSPNPVPSDQKSDLRGGLAGGGDGSGIGSPAAGRSSFSQRLQAVVEKKEQSLDSVVAYDDGLQMGRQISPSTGLPAMEPSPKQQITQAAVEKPRVDALQENAKSFGISGPISEGFSQGTVVFSNKGGSSSTAAPDVNFLVTNAVVANNAWFTDQFGNVPPGGAPNESIADLWGNPSRDGAAKQESKSQSTFFRAILPQDTDGDAAVRSEQLARFGSFKAGKGMEDDEKKRAQVSRNVEEGKQSVTGADGPSVNAFGYVDIPQATKDLKDRAQIALPQSGQIDNRENAPQTGPIVVDEIQYNPAQSLLSGTEDRLSNSGKSGAKAPGNTVLTTIGNPTEVAAVETQVENARAVRDKLAVRLRQEEIDANIPKSGIVDVVEPAEPEPSKNPTLWERVRGAVSGDVERKARVKLERDIGDIAGLGTDRSGFDPYWIQNEFETIKSKAVLSKAVEKLQLDQTSTEKRDGSAKATEDAVQRLRKSTDVQRDPKTGLVDIRVKSEKAEEAARIANAIADAYRDVRREQRLQLSQHGIENLKTQLAQQEQTVARAEKQLEQKRKELSANVIEHETVHMHTDDAVSQYRAMSQLYSALTNLSPQQLSKAISTSSPEPKLGELLEHKAAVEQQLSTLTASDNPDPAAVANTQRASEEISKEIDARARQVLLELKEKTEKLGRAITETTAGDTASAKPAIPASVPQPEVQAAENPFSTFSLNVSDVSFKLAAASLEKGVMPDAASVRSEEFINAFDYRDPEPPPGAPIAFYWDRARYPFAHNREIVRFAVKTAATGRQAGRPLNLVLLLDNSGSMERADRVRIIQECLRVLATQLQPQDRVSVVGFSRTARLWVDGMPGSEASDLPKRVGTRTPEGGTNLEEAMNLAYQTASRHYLNNGINRVVLLTDGAANLGDVQPDSLKKKVEAQRMQGIALDCFGIGWEGFNDDLLEVLSRNGDGRYGFVNTPEAAATEFAGQLAGALHVAASDVKVQVEFNPRRVTTYRQIGYAKHQLKKEQFRDNTVDAAEIGAAEAGNALYVVQIDPRGEGSIATVRLRYKVPGTTEYHEKEWPVYYSGNAKPLDQSTPAMRLATVASAFSEWLVSSPYAAEVAPAQLLTYLAGVPETCPADPRPKKLEWMIRQAGSISGR